MSLQVYLAYIAACVALALLPGPIVTLVIANGLRHGTRAALTNIAGVQAAMTIVIGIVAIGLTSLHGDHGLLVRLGALCRRRLSGLARIQTDPPARRRRRGEAPPPPRGGFFLQGFLVALSNPKLLVFFGAFIPQFVDMSQGSFSAGRDPRHHLHDGRGPDRRRLRAARRSCAIVLFGAANTACCRGSPAAS